MLDPLHEVNKYLGEKRKARLPKKKKKIHISSSKLMQVEEERKQTEKKLEQKKTIEELRRERLERERKEREKAHRR
jgi:hypothetical protein